MKTTDSPLLPESRINNCTAEEADPRLVRYVINCNTKRYGKVVARTEDTDVLVLLSYSRR